MMTTIQIAVIVMAVVSGTLAGYVLTMRHMVGFIGREYEKTKGHHRRMTDGARLNAAFVSRLSSREELMAARNRARLEQYEIKRRTL